MNQPSALVIRTAGTNCDTELVRAFDLAGATPESIHLDALCADPSILESFDLIGFPGGFSYGDDISSGRIKAMHARQHLLPELKNAASRGVPIIGICNGFQVLVQLGLLPGNTDQPCLALTQNEHGRFIDDWAVMEVNPQSPCVWTQELQEFDDPETCRFPYAHAEGRLVMMDSFQMDPELIALRYQSNINGSVDRIAGVCDPTGLIFGLMPHPERMLDWNRHPFATRLSRETKNGPTPGLSIFTSAIAAIQNPVGTP
ncbi:MAG: phosphoribosylformylglycinamidine synthase subunit PurQ [Phycisphaerales bacterium]